MAKHAKTYTEAELKAQSLAEAIAEDREYERRQLEAEDRD